MTLQYSQLPFSGSQMHINRNYSTMQVWNKLPRVIQCRRPISHVFQTSGSFSRIGVILQCYEWLAVWNDVCVPGRFCSLPFPISSEMRFGIIHFFLFYYYFKSFKELKLMHFKRISKYCLIGNKYISERILFH